MQTRTILRFLLTASLLCSAFACSADGAHDAEQAPHSPDSTNEPTPDDEPDVRPDAGKATDASNEPRSDASTSPTSVKLTIADAEFENSTAAGGGFAYSFDFSIDNGASVDVTSVDEMSVDFGGGQVVTLTRPVCSGSYPIAAGARRGVSFQIAASDSGSLSMFAFICPGRQVFGGASGKAPPTASFAGPVTITASGKTKAGSFTATGSASRAN